MNVLEFFKHYRVNVAPEGEEPVLVWRKYKDNNQRNRAKAWRKKRKLAGMQDNKPKPKRSRVFRRVHERNAKKGRI